MKNDNHGMELTVTVPADQWATVNRRVRLLEAALIQTLRKGGGLKEWFTAAELAALALPGLPTSKNGMTRFARAHGWPMRSVTCQGGERHVYHFSALPQRAFVALVDDIVKNPPPMSEQIGNADDATRSAPVPPPPELPANAAAPWMLPLMRIIRAKGGGASLERALEELPRHLPKGVQPPTREKALEALRAIGMVAG